jgi:hypothetical protein
MPDLIDRPLNMPTCPTHSTPPGSTVDLDTPDALPTERLDQTEQWKRQEYRDEVLQIAAKLFQGHFAYGTTPITDRDIVDAVQAADRLIRAVDKFVKGPEAPESEAKMPRRSCSGPLTPAPIDGTPLTADELADLRFLSSHLYAPPSSLRSSRSLYKRGLIFAHDGLYYPTPTGLELVDRHAATTVEAGQ